MEGDFAYGINPEGRVNNVERARNPIQFDHVLSLLVEGLREHFDPGLPLCPLVALSATAELKRAAKTAFWFNTARAASITAVSGKSAKLASVNVLRCIYGGELRQCRGYV